MQVVEASVAGVPNCEVGDEWNHPLDDAILVACKSSNKYDVNVEDCAFPVNRRNVSNRKERLFYNLIRNIVEKGNNYWAEWYAKKFSSKIYIYGAGEVGVIFARLIGLDKVAGFIDIYVMGNVDGVEIYNRVDQIEEKMYPVVISYISDYDSELTIKKELSDCGLSCICISELIDTAL